MEIKLEVGKIPKTEAIIEVYNSSGILRPTKDRNRIEKMYAHSNLIISAWKGEELVGVARSLTDYCYACYLSDLAVKKEYQSSGIGKQLIERTKKEIGEHTALILLAAPSAMEYYPKLGFEKIENGYLIKRKS